MQRGFEFPHQQPPLSLLLLEKEPEDRFEELDSHGGAESALRRREMWGTYSKAEFKAGLQLFWQSISKTRKLYRWSRNGEQDVERGMSKMKREQGINDPIQPGGERKRCGLDCKNGAIHPLEFLGVPGGQSLCNLLFVGEVLIQGAWRDPGLSCNTIGVGLVVAHFGKDRFSSSKNGSDALDPSRSSLNRLCGFQLIHTVH